MAETGRPTESLSAGVVRAVYHKRKARKGAGLHRYPDCVRKENKSKTAAGGVIDAVFDRIADSQAPARAA